MFERFTDTARGAVTGAQEEARALGHDAIGAEHLLLALAATPDAPGAARSPAAETLRRLGVDHDRLRRHLAAGPDADAQALRSIGVDLDAVRRSAEESFGPGALDPGRRRRRRGGLLQVLAPGHLPFTDAAKAVLENSLREALTLHHRTIGTGHLLLGLLHTEHSPAARLLLDLGVPPSEVRSAVLAQLGTAA
ncbi:hypothetical protein NUM3379_13490 [Kineococcus sp. NUM-3379]